MVERMLEPAVVDVAPLKEKKLNCLRRPVVMTVNQKYRKLMELVFFLFFLIELDRSNLTIHDGWMIYVV